MAPVALYTEFQVEPSDSIVQAMSSELAAIMEPVGIRFEWKSLAGAKPAETAAQLAVIGFKGRCEAPGISPLPRDPGPLGFTHVSEGVILPFTDIDCGRIRSFVQKELAMRPVDDREKLYGRALARVLAHELFHMCVKTPKHASHGLGKAYYFVGELIAERFRFDDSDLSALRGSGAVANLESTIDVAKKASRAGSPEPQ